MPPSIDASISLLIRAAFDRCWMMGLQRLWKPYLGRRALSQGPFGPSLKSLPLSSQIIAIDIGQLL